ncbi:MULTISPECIES: ComF family protein [Thalassobacillus]|uniref:ComF family protein n=1 Tax=Thalassobacillus TaxID=331971 RepID=UPI000A1CA182|nr:ComF family protein [Thalassobacillus devorans]
MHCLNCHEIILHQVTWSNLFSPPSDKKICENCFSQLERISLPQCSICARPMDVNGICQDCERWESEESWRGILEKNVAVFNYNETMKGIVARWKYRGDYILIEMFKYELQEVFQLHFSQQDLLLVPIPLSQERMGERGFNQALAIASLIKAPVREVLTRIHGEKQSKKSRKERVNTENPFQLLEQVSKPVLLVDDIYTTGTTLRHAAKLLKEGGAPAVYSFTLVRSG